MFWRKAHFLHFSAITLIFGLNIGYSQSETEIYLAGISQIEGGFKLSYSTNISLNPGYDNQPTFGSTNNTLWYSRTRDRQTDIVEHIIESGKLKWLTDTPQGSEYSPQPIPESEAFSAIRLDTNGLQRLYRYNRNGFGSVILDTLKIGYTLWISPEELICTVLTGNGMDLYRANIHTDTYSLIEKSVGRSLTKIPETGDISFTRITEQGIELKSYNIDSGTQSTITLLPDKIQDICWLPDGSLICGGEDVLRQYIPGMQNYWQVVHRFRPGFGWISRLAINESGTLLALVADKKP